MPQHIIILCIGFLLDLLFGDPHYLWHPVQGIGKLIEWTEAGLFSLFHIQEERESDKGKKRAAGFVLVLVVPGLTVGITAVFLYLTDIFCPWLNFITKCIICYQMLAMKSLRVESMKVYDALKEEGLERARYAVSMIVGRDTENLSEEGVIKAAVETVAENTSDGVIAPLFYIFLLGPLGGVFYKAVNTMDSMIAYKNDRYCYFGTAAARLDDILNFLPARISALSMVVAAFFLGLDGKNGWYIFKRDRYNHKSPNSAQTEAVCAGALNVQLAGDAYYFGELTKKPTIGNANRSVEIEDIRRANQLLYGTSILVLMAEVGISVILLSII